MSLRLLPRLRVRFALARHQNQFSFARLSIEGKMKIADVLDAGHEVIRMLGEYSGRVGGFREMAVDLLVYGYLQGKFASMQRQHYVRMHSRPRPQRIDFRFGTSNPVVIEFAVRPPDGGGELYGSQNVPELRKLTRVIPSKAKTRILLLIDLCKDPLSHTNLKLTYRSVNAGRGRFTRHTVCVIYVHRHKKECYSFKWRPRRN